MLFLAGQYKEGYFESNIVSRQPWGMRKTKFIPTGGPSAGHIAVVCLAQQGGPHFSTAGITAPCAKGTQQPRVPTRYCELVRPEK